MLYRGTLRKSQKGSLRITFSAPARPAVGDQLLVTFIEAGQPAAELLTLRDVHLGERLSLGRDQFTKQPVPGSFVLWFDPAPLAAMGDRAELESFASMEA